MAKTFYARKQLHRTGKPGQAVSIDSRQFEEMLGKLAQATGAGLSDVILAEAASVLGKTLQKTGASTAWLVKMKYTYTETGDNALTIPYVRLNGRKVRTRSIKRRGMWVQQKNGKVWKPDRLNPEWTQLQKELKRLHKIARRRKGLAKATWLRIAQMAKLPPLKPKPPAYVTTALAGFTQRLKSVTKGTRIMRPDEGKYSISIYNWSSTAMAPQSKKGPGGYTAFKRAIRGRVDHFNYSLAKGAFKSVDKMIKKYPGIAMTPVQR